ncbi:MAG: ANTAR domain-containing response regulator [Longimicrobiales bacterium]
MDHQLRRRKAAPTGIRILVAEDEPLSALALKGQLEALGHSVIGPAGDGREAIRLAAEREPGLAILDIRMPEVSGLEAAEEIFRHHPIPILLLTGYSSPEYIDRATVLPVFHYLVKPVTMDDLVPAIGVARARFSEWARYRSDVEDLQNKLKERALVDRAKSVLMQTRRLSEPDAYRVLQKESQNRNIPMVDVARTVLLAETVLREDLGS